MANFLIVVDPDPNRRSQFIRTLEPLISLVEGLVTRSCSTGSFQAIWAAHPTAPVSWVADQEGAAVIWGEAIVQAESSRIEAVSLRKVWQDPVSQTLPTFDGFYAASVYHPDSGLVIGADLLGFFPVYYYMHGDVALVGSSPELFRYHPLFRASFNPAGLVGILLTNGLFKGQTLWQNVLRLSAGHQLIWQPHRSPREVKQYEIPGSSDHNPYEDLAFTDQLDLLEKLLETTLVRHTTVKEEYSLLLSGGLDSRTFAGFLRELEVPTKALTLGVRADVEMECATSVARTLGLDHHTFAIPFEQYSVGANLAAKWEHLANGFSMVMINWPLHSCLSDLAAKVISGYGLDRVIGGPRIVGRSGENSASNLFFERGINNCGLSPQLLEQLLRKEVFGDLVQDTLADIQKVYKSYSDLEPRRAWWFELYHRQRFHIGGSGWQLCFGAWPVLPVLDWHLLKTVAVLPLKTMAERRAERELLCRRFPQLASLPLDRNAFNYYIEPLRPSRQRQQLDILFRLQRKWRQLQQKLGYDRRYYYRIFNPNNRGWQQIRRQGEPYREKVRYLFNEKLLDQVLPTPDVHIPFTGSDPIPGVSGMKTLLGLMLWSKEHL